MNILKVMGFPLLNGKSIRRSTAGGLFGTDFRKSDTDLEKRYVKLISYGEQSETFKQRILENGLKIMSEEVGIILREAVPGDAKDILLMMGQVNKETEF